MYGNKLFLLKKTVDITHSYSPHVGYQWLSEDLDFNHESIIEGKFLEKDDNLANYCVSTTDYELILSKFKEKSSSRVLEVHYILSTGANWKGAIKKFRLEITPPTTSISIILGCIEIPLKKEKRECIFMN
ncbi:DUF4424 family protein [Rickettsia endosymbiont of Cantharis rufa]|uniref:DUF4424 family protein n=1 Tax=Rickettsia endosymbiont of Cantharis rufa TaxID=3066248 RepID=UPI00313328B7